MEAVVLLSGGLDSTVSLAKAVNEYEASEVTALHLHYGQRHNIETESARKVAEFYKVRLIERDLTSIFAFSDSAMLSHGKEVPRGTYAEQLGDKDGIVDTYVPFRNGLFISIAAAIAFSLEAEEVWISAHQDDAAGNAYPDCTTEFMEEIAGAIYIGTGKKVKTIAPFIYNNKADIVAVGLELSAPLDLSWSCYDPVTIEGKSYHCGVCGTCIDRFKAFQENCETDPVLYAPLKEDI